MRSFVNFQGLTVGDIITRLFLWFFAPQFTAFFVGASSEWWPTLLGEACVGAVVYRDAARANRRAPVTDAAIALIPFLGWWRYACVRGVEIDVRTVSAGLARPSSRMWDLRWSRTIAIDTVLPVDACAALVRQLTIPWWSPLEGFASVATHPLGGQVKSEAFRVHRRRALSRGIFYLEARGRIIGAATGSRVVVTFGRTGWTNFGLIAPIVFLLLWTSLAVGAGTSETRPTALLFGVGFLVLWIASAALITWVGRDDDVYLEVALRSALSPSVA